MHGFILDGDAIRETESLAEIEKAHEEKKVYWLDIGEQTTAKTKFLTETLHIHPLVVEDIWHERSIPKIEDFDTYLYVLVHGVARSSKASSGSSSTRSRCGPT